MKFNPWAFGIVFIAIVAFLMFNNFQIPTYFLFEKTDETKATITDINWAYGIKCHQLQLLTDEYEVADSTYSDKFKAGMGYDLKKIGDKLLVKYSIKKPKKNKVIGQFKPNLKRPTENKVGDE